MCHNVISGDNICMSVYIYQFDPHNNIRESGSPLNTFVERSG